MADWKLFGADGPARHTADQIKISAHRSAVKIYERFMIKIRRSDERGHANHGWLDSYHTFSFAGYQDSKFMGFRSLRVINEDRIAGAQGFGTHPHHNMEIITYVLEGALEHKDSMGTGSVIRPGDIQIMSAGTGVTHSEFNHSKKEPAHLLQIWILPNSKNLTPSYQQKNFGGDKRKGKLCLLVSPDGADGSVIIHQDVYLFASILNAGQKITHVIKSQRHAWVQVVRGSILVNHQLLEEGDGAAISSEAVLEFLAQNPAEFLLFDLA